jgi:general secretion pathway protein H
MIGCRPRKSQLGVTLVEILIVVALLALVTGGVVGGSGMLGTTQLRAASTSIMAAIRVAGTRANTTGLPTRLVFDLESRSIQLEETSGRMLRRLSTDEREQDPSAGASPATQAERAAQAEAQRILEGPREPSPSFTLVPEFNRGGPKGKPGRALGGTVKYKYVQTEHDMAPRVDGRAYLYFWPGGGTEKAVIVLTRLGGDEEGVSILVSGLTGRSEIVRGSVSLEEPGEADFGERESE